MPRRVVCRWLVLAIVAWPCRSAGQSAPPPAAQNPSPMVEHTRTHERIAQRTPPGIERTLTGTLPTPVQVFLPAGTARGGERELVIHFHGAAFIAEHAAPSAESIIAVVNVGSGGGAYDRAFADPDVFERLLEGVATEASTASARQVTLGRITLSGFSAGYGAVRAILRQPRFFDRIGAVLLLDGLHASYVPDRKVMADGGTIDEAALEVFVRYAGGAIAGQKSLLITHSEIFPGTFASTTETTDHLLRVLGVRRTPILRWGPVGMQQLSEARQGGLLVMGFAGNSAPDHIDHLHGMPEFLRSLIALVPPKSR